MKRSQSKSGTVPKKVVAPSIVRIMFADLCRKYPAFDTFYSDNKADIDKTGITWEITATAKNEGTSSPVTNSIVLKKYPRSQEDARTVAHEIEHLLIWEQGYPYVIADIHADDELYYRLHQSAQAIQGTVFEPMVESKTKKYFKNVCAVNHTSAMKGLSKLIENKEKIIPELEEPRALLYYSCLYVQKRQILELTCTTDKTDEYTRKFAVHFGETILPCADKITDLIKKHTTRSPDSVRMILSGILRNRNCDFGYRWQDEFNRFVIDR
jgi:hypothetical protein